MYTDLIDLLCVFIQGRRRVELTRQRKCQEDEEYLCTQTYVRTYSRGSKTVPPLSPLQQYTYQYRVYTSILFLAWPMQRANESSEAGI